MQTIIIIVVLLLLVIVFFPTQEGFYTCSNILYPCIQQYHKDTSDLIQPKLYVDGLYTVAKNVFLK